MNSNNNNDIKRKYEEYSRKEDMMIPFHLTEFIASKIIEQLGVPVQKVSLGYDNEKECCLIEMFEDKVIELDEFATMLEERTNSSHLTTIFKGKFYKFWLDSYKNFLHYMAGEIKFGFSKEEFNEFLFRTVAIDLLIENTDRHPLNIGFINKDSIYYIAPLYDNCNSLWLSNYMAGHNKERRYPWVNLDCTSMYRDELVETYKDLLSSHIRKYANIDINFIPIAKEIKEAYGDKYNNYLEYLAIRYIKNREELLSLTS